MEVQLKGINDLFYETRSLFHVVTRGSCVQFTDSYHPLFCVKTKRY